MWIKYLMILVYALGNCIPPAPIMLMNVVGAISPNVMRERLAAKVVWLYFLISLPFMFFHFSNGVEVGSYLKSYLGSVFILFTSVGLAIYFSRLGDLDWYFKRTAVAFFLIFCVSTMSFVVTSNVDVLGGWYDHDYAMNSNINRYGGYMYEASHYALVVAPVFFYFVNRVLTRYTHTDLLHLLLTTVPLLATYSLGFWFTFFIALLLAMLIGGGKMRGRAISFIIALTFIMSVAVFSSVEIHDRVIDVLSFEDSSVNVRTFNAYTLATMIAERKSYIWGAGIGQIKEVGYSIIMDFYKFSAAVDTVDIPSSSAEMLATFGALGFIIKTAILIFLYIKGRVYRHQYSNLLFIFMFIYQYYGSFMISTIEIFCFSFAVLLTYSDGGDKKNQ